MSASSDLGKGFLLDTSAVLAYYRGEPEGATVTAVLMGDAPVMVASPTAAEFCRAVGAESSSNGHDAAHEWGSLRQLFTAVLPIEEATAIESLRLSDSSPERLPLTDALIAACASLNGLRLVHRDQHLRGIPLTVLDQLDLAAQAP